VSTYASVNHQLDVAMVTRTSYRVGAMLCTSRLQLLYLFQLDYGYQNEVLAVACGWPYPSRIAFTPAHAPGSQGPGYTPPHSNSFTVLEGYRTAEMMAREFCSKLVFMLEEDIFVVCTAAAPQPHCRSLWCLIAVVV
jgi:hypothetical protein